MLKMRFGKVRSLLCFGCHADDIEIGCGGTLLKLLSEQPGIAVHWVVLSADGVRAREAAASADLFLADAGAKHVVIKDYRDSFFPYAGRELKEYFHELSHRVSPDVIFTHARSDEHQDHELVADLTRCAFRDHLILGYEIPKYDGDLGHPNVYAPLDEPTCRRKLETITRVFRTQHGKQWFSEDTFWAMLRIRGLECNSESKYAEAFHCHKLIL